MLATSNPFSTSPMIEFIRDNSSTAVTVLATAASYTTLTNDQKNLGGSIQTTPRNVNWATGTIDNDTFTNPFTFTITGLSSPVTFMPMTVDAVYMSLCVPTISYISTAITPEPGTIALFGLGLASVLAGVIRKRAKTTPAA